MRIITLSKMTTLYILFFELTLDLMPKYMTNLKPNFQTYNI